MNLEEMSLGESHSELFEIPELPPPLTPLGAKQIGSSKDDYRLKIFNTNKI